MTKSPIDTLVDLMMVLRDPEHGCSWDIIQTPATIVPFTIEEAYEVADAVDRADVEDLRDELGDLLLQVVFQARMAEEAEQFTFDDVVRTIAAKLIRRHPHVFDANGNVLALHERPDPEAVASNWRRIKAEERAGRARRDVDLQKAQPLDGVPLALPALIRADKISRKAVGYGFDWPSARDVIGKVREETDEVEASLADGDLVAIGEEIGDLLFSVVNLARHAGVDPEEALRRGTKKFERRFNAMAECLHESGRTLAESDLDAMEAAWQFVKRSER